MQGSTGRRHSARAGFGTRGWGFAFHPRFARYFGIRSRLCQATLLAALIIAGVILQATHGTAWALVGFAALFTLAAAARAASIPFLRKQRDPEEWPAHKGVPLSHFLSAFWHRADARLLALLLAMQVAVQMGQPFLNPYLLKQLDVSPALYLGLIAASFAAKSIALPFLGNHAKSRGARSLLAIGAVGTALMILPWIWVDWIPGMFAIQAASGVFQGAWNSLRSSSSLRRFPPTNEQAL